MMTEFQKELLFKDLIQFIKDGDLDSVEELIHEGANIHENFSEPLRLAVEMQNIQIVEILVKKYKANVNVMDGAPLRVSVENNNLEIAKILLENKANPNLKPKTYKKEPVVLSRKQMKKYRSNFPKSVIPTLSIAVGEDNLPIVKMLIEYGANLSEENYCVIQCISSPEMLVYIGKRMDIDTLDKQREILGFTKSLSQEVMEKFDKAVEKVKIINKIEAV